MTAAAVDSMIADYLVQAMHVGYNPATDPDGALAAEREAAFRLFLWAEMTVPPTVLVQLSDTNDRTWRDTLERVVLIHLPEAQIPPASLPWIQSRTQALVGFHVDAFDCRIVAEAETIRAAALLTFDHRLRKHLNSHATLPIITPSEYWARLAIPRGTPPLWAPSPSNPVSGETWWHW
jgi:hypothetical protein